MQKIRDSAPRTATMPPWVGEDGCVFIPRALLGFIKSGEVSAYALYVYMAIAEIADGGTSVFTTLDRLASITRHSVRSVQRAIDQLVFVGAMTTTRTPRGLEIGIRQPEAVAP